jgi:hypothetical protein
LLTRCTLDALDPNHCGHSLTSSSHCHSITLSQIEYLDEDQVSLDDEDMEDIAGETLSDD